MKHTDEIIGNTKCLPTPLQPSVDWIFILELLQGLNWVKDLGRFSGFMLLYLWYTAILLSFVNLFGVYFQYLKPAQNIISANRIPLHKLLTCVYLIISPFMFCFVFLSVCVCVRWWEPTKTLFNKSGLPSRSECIHSTIWSKFELVLEFLTSTECIHSSIWSKFELVLELLTSTLICTTKLHFYQ